MQKRRQSLRALLKSLILGKKGWSAAWFHYILITLKLAYNRNKLLKTLYYWSRYMLNFDFLDKGLGIVPPAPFVYDFSRKVFLILYSINWPNFIAWLPLLLEMLGNMRIAILVNQAVTSWILKLTLSFQSSRFFYITKKSWQILKYLENENNFSGEIIRIFHHVQRTFSY